MFTYIHGYNSIYWKGLIKRGLVDNTSGVKITQCVFNHESDCFNVIANTGSELYEIIRESNRTFYVDRLLGGVFFHGYKFDKRIIAMYKNMLNDKFLGFQMHEWISNLNSDWYRLTEANCIGGSAEVITKAILEKYPYKFPFLETHSAEEFSRLKKPDNAKELIIQAKLNFEKRQGECDGLLLPADSYFMAPKVEIALGAKQLMPEVGAQIPNTRIQLAYTRGMASTNGITWGIYYEPWGGEPFGSCNYKRDGMNEWNISNNGDFAFGQYGENGGSSRSLQKRIHRYAFMSGASYISEEWGVCNTFYDWIDFDLSPYGRVKKEFLDFINKMPQPIPFNPIALVLPNDLEVFDISYSHEYPNKYLNMTVDPYMSDKLKKIWHNLNIIFQNSTDALYKEDRIMQNSKYPDIFDIIHADDKSAMYKYDHIIDLTGDIADLENKVNDLLPCHVEGNVHWLISQTDTEWIISIFNNSGVSRTVEKGDVYDETASTVAKISLKNNKSLKHLDGSEKITKKGGGYDVELSAGDWIIASFCK